jgi:hypothetical protein
VTGKHDPKRDPKPGDVIDLKDSTVEVLMRKGEALIFISRGLTGPPINRIPIMCKGVLAGWYRMTKGGTVLHVSD